MMNPADEVWILGATGRTGRAVARHLIDRGLRPVLVGRSASRLQALALTLGAELPVVEAPTLERICEAIARANPRVVINTIGPYSETALPVIQAGGANSHYLDISNELGAVIAVLDEHARAVSTGRCLVTGAGWGVLGAESIVLKLCEGRAPATSVRVDSVPLLAGDPDVMGEALAGSVVHSLGAGGLRYAGSKLVKAGFGSDATELALPDGSRARTGLVPSGDLEAARRASGAPDVVIASSEVPTSLAMRLALAALRPLVGWKKAREALIDRIARMEIAPRPHGRSFSWCRALVSWPDGTRREGFLRAPEGMAFTTATMAEVASRLLRGEGRPGAYTPGALFGPDLAIAVGGMFVLEALPTSREQS